MTMQWKKKKPQNHHNYTFIQKKIIESAITWNTVNNTR